jgi:hypothetical protein
MVSIMATFQEREPKVKGERKKAWTFYCQAESVRLRPLLSSVVTWTIVLLLPVDRDTSNSHSATFFLVESSSNKSASNTQYSTWVFIVGPNIYYKGKTQGSPISNYSTAAHCTSHICLQVSLQYIVTCISGYRWDLHWMNGFIKALYNKPVITSNREISLIYTIFSSQLHTH